jgi:hypothetical protein
MPSGFETIMVEALRRMKVAGNAWPALENVRRAHKTAVPKDASNKIEVGLHVIDGGDAPAKRPSNADCAQRECDLTLAIFVRSDAGPAAADPMKLEAMRRMNPATAPWPSGVSIAPGPIKVDDELADADSIRVEMIFNARYAAAGEWAL